jgi:hypothetical protein
MAQPFDSLRESLAASKRKGRPFGEAWLDGLTAVTMAGASSGETRELLQATQAAWRRAYVDEPATPIERAAAELLMTGATVPGSEADELPARPPCSECGGAMEGRHHTAVTCGDSCADERRRRLQRTRKPHIAHRLQAA